MDLGLSGRCCIVTGASRGIGLATARLLASEGARVLLVARNAERLCAAAATCGGEVETLALDVTATGAGETMVTACTERLGPLHALVCNAGTSRVADLEELTDADWEAQWRLNVLAPMWAMRAAAPAMRARGGGRIVNVCSSSGKRPSARNGAYSVTKAAQLALSRVYADQLAPDGILVNAVAPGPIATPLWTGPGGLADQVAERLCSSREAVLAERAASLPVRRMGTDEEVAAVIAFLCSDQASNVAGSAWSVDGGAVPFAI